MHLLKLHLEVNHSEEPELADVWFLLPHEVFHAMHCCEKGQALETKLFSVNVLLLHSFQPCLFAVQEPHDR